MLALLQSRLEENVKRLDTLQHPDNDVQESCQTDQLRNERDERNLVLMAQAQSEMFNLDLKNMSTYKYDDNYGDSQPACMTIAGQLESCDERNLNSAMLSLEKAVNQYDSEIMQKVEASAEAIEGVVLALNEKLKGSKLEMARSHDCSKLLTATVDTNYATMRDGYLELIRKVYAEASIQWKALFQLQDPTSEWHLGELQRVIEEAKSNAEVIARREQIYETARQQLDRFCSESFERIRSNTAYQEKEQLMQQLNAARRNVSEHKSQLVQETESTLNSAVSDLDTRYLEPLEGINQQLFDLQDLLNQVVLYDRRLTQLQVLLTRREARMDRLGRVNSEESSTRCIDSAHVPASGSSSSSSSSSGARAVADATKAGTTTAAADEAAAEEIVRLGQRSMQDLQAPFRLGTALRGLAASCDLSAEDTERLLGYVLFDSGATAGRDG